MISKPFHQLLEELKNLMHQPSKLRITLKPPTQLKYSHELQEHKALGRHLIQAGKVGSLLVAGGQGTRLGFNGPKGCYPITPAQHQTLFGYFAKRLKAASELANKKLPLAIMTSFINHEEVVQHFQDNQFFGCDSEQISFFSQGKLPFLDDHGNPCIDESGGIAFGPDGNGASLSAFVNSSLAKQWADRGIEHMTYTLIDNPLADPFDPLLVGYHAFTHAQATIKGVLRDNQSEKVGLIVDDEGKTAVVEYTEMPPEEFTSPKYGAANISLFCFSMPFVIQAAKDTLPLHKAYKLLSKGSYAWKFEKYIFDVLPLASSIQTIIYPRSECFAPLKDLADVDKVKSALTQRDLKTIQEITGQIAPNTCLEIDAAFYYPTAEIFRKWQNLALPKTSYIKA
jgi:UDP-N-acetylglucosamine/UDP-N-acetylgalactosamine diphosphorylase